MRSRPSICSVILLYGRSTNALSCGLKLTSSPVSVARTMRLVPMSRPLTSILVALIRRTPDLRRLPRTCARRVAASRCDTIRLKTESIEHLGHEFAELRAAGHGVCRGDFAVRRRDVVLQALHQIDQPTRRPPTRRP